MSKRATPTRSKRKPAIAPSGDSPPVGIPRPSLHREDRLPIYAVGSVKFEELCRDVLRHAHPQITRRTLKRTSGQRQYGVDVEGFTAEHDSEVVVSCKCYRDVDPDHLLPWTQDFFKHLDNHWKGKGVKFFILAVTHPGNSDELTAAIRQCRDLLKPHGIKFEIWDTLEITDLLRKEPALVDRYFNRAWVEAISPQVVTADGLSQGFLSATSGRSADILAITQEIAIAALASQVNALVGQRIEDANAEYRAGRSARLVACLDELQGDAANWASLDPSIKARVLRARAMFALNADEVPKAGELLDAADAIAPAPDRSTRAWYVRAIDGPQAAKDCLSSPQSARETEVLATLHIETGNASGALALLDQAQPPATPEQIRLRALAQCLNGEREAAVVTAAKATAGPMPSMAAVQSHAILHVMAALAPAADIQLGAVPNPFSSALVRVTPDATAHLDQAIDILSRQIPLVDPHLAGDLELWKLAALLIHPTRTRDARQFADELLDRTIVDPLAAAWCHSSGMRLRYGRIRKSFEDAIRAGTATPAHVIVLAMFEAERTSDSSAAQLIARHRAAFPEDDAFLSGWQKRFEGDPGSDTYAAAMHQAERRTFGPLMEFVSKQACSANQILAAASLLAMKREWPLINSFRDKLLSLGTPRAVDLAARAAIESGASADAIAIIDASAGVFPHGQIPEGLLYLRARAHDAQGNKGAALADMRTVAKTSRDPAISNQLIRSLISTGNLKEAHKHAKSYVKLPSVKPLELVQLAHVFKSLNPDFSRSLIKKAADDPKLPSHAVAGVMALANTLGLAKIEGRMMRLIGEITKDGSAAGIFRYDNIEDVIAFMKERGEALEQEYSLWRAGMKPGHFVFGAKTFAGLYVADPRDRLDAFHKPLPMLARAANAERRSVPDTNAGSRPDLILDISALLLAMRCDLLPVVEKAYRIQIPPSVPFALLAIEEDWPAFSDEFIQAARAWLSDTATAVRTIEAAPADVLAIGTDQHPPELIPDRLEAACRRAIVAGHLSQSVAAQFLSADQTDAPVQPATAISALVVQPWALVKMAQAGILEPIAKTLPVYISGAARKEFAANIAMAERQTAMQHRITELRELVAERLSSNSWTTLAHQATAKGDKRTKAAPHVRCLLEIMDSVNAGTATCIWAEDRTMSRTRLPGLLNIVDVADDLLKRGFIDADRYRVVDTNLRQLGYAFMPLPIAAIAADVERASVADGVLVESPELTHWRCWYAQEVERLAFANQAPEPDDTGRYIGEPRHLLNMMAAARDVLSSIWSNTKTTPEDKVARSNWVWTCLRFETSPALQWSTKSDAAQQALMATVMFHTADLPLMSELNSDRLPVAARQPYMDWFVRNVLDVRCVVDPVLGDSFARQLAALLVPQLDRDTEDESDKDAQKYVKLVVARYLELFPDNWRDRILSHCDLAEKLGTTSVMALDVGEASIPACDIEGAIAGAANKVTPDNPVSVELSLADGKMATLTVRRETTGHLSAEISAGEDKAHLDAFLVAVTLRDPAERLAALQAVPGALDLPKEQLSATLREIASLPTLTERVVRQKAAFDLEFVRRLDRVRDQLTHKQSVELSDLSLPAPEALAQYLRLNDLYRPQAGSWLEEMTAALVSDRGIEIAVRRVGAVPFDLPYDFVKHIADIDVKLEEISSAAHARLYLKAWAKSGVPSARHQVLGVFLDRLQAQSKVMASLLWKGVRQLGRSEAWKRLHPDIAYTLLWVWADRLASSITSTAVDTDKASEIIRRSEPVDLTHMFAADDLRPWYRHDTFEITEGGVMAALIADVLPFIDCKGLPADLRGRLLSTVGTETNDVWYPRIDLAFPVAVEPTKWTTKDVVAGIESSGVAQVMKPFGERNADRYVQALMAEPVSPQNPFLVPGMLAGSDLSVLSMETVGALTAYLEVLLRDYASMADDPSYRHAQVIRAACLGVLNDAVEIDATLARMSSAYHVKHGHQKSGYIIDVSQSPLYRDFAQLVEVVVAASRRRPGSATAKVAAMAETFEKIPESWPGARLGLIELLDRMTDMLEAKLVVVFWPSLLRLRMAP